jgi:hypothetical protein
MFNPTKLQSNFGFSIGVMMKPSIRHVWTKFRPRISVARARKALHTFSIGGIYCFRYTYIDFYREFRPDVVRKSGQAVSHIIEWSSVDSRHRAELLLARDKHAIRNAIRSEQWPFTLADNTFRRVFSQNLGKLTFNISL